jgi:hypothetical protein
MFRRARSRSFHALPVRVDSLTAIVYRNQLFLDAKPITRLTVKVTGTNRMAAFATGVTIPLKSKRLMAAKAVRIVRTVTTARIGSPPIFDEMALG